MELKNKLIRNRSHLTENFSISEMMTYMQAYPRGYTNFVEKDLKCEKKVDKALLELLGGKLDLCAEKEAVEGILREMSEDCCHEFFNENKEKIEQILPAEFSVEKIRNCFYKMMFLHIQAKCPIQDVSYMKKILREEKEAAYKKVKSEKSIILRNELNFVLPCGEEKNDGEISLCQLENEGYVPVQVGIEGKKVRRTLFHGELLYAVKKGEGYVGFLPRLTEKEREYARISLMQEKLQDFSWEMLQEEECSIEGERMYYRTMDSMEVKQKKVVD